MGGAGAAVGGAESGHRDGDAGKGEEGFDDIAFPHPRQGKGGQERPGFGQMVDVPVPPFALSRVAEDAGADAAGPKGAAGIEIMTKSEARGFQRRPRERQGPGEREQKQIGARRRGQVLEARRRLGVLETPGQRAKDGQMIAPPPNLCRLPPPGWYFQSSRRTSRPSSIRPTRRPGNKWRQGKAARIRLPGGSKRQYRPDPAPPYGDPAFGPFPTPRPSAISLPRLAPPR